MAAILSLGRGGILSPPSHRSAGSVFGLWAGVRPPPSPPPAFCPALANRIAGGAARAPGPPRHSDAAPCKAPAPRLSSAATGVGEDGHVRGTSQSPGGA